jgi:hypothetical protein
MGAEALEGGASLLWKEYVGLGLDMRVHNLHADDVRAGRLVTRNRTAAKQPIHGALLGLGARGKSSRL